MSGWSKVIVEGGARGRNCSDFGLGVEVGERGIEVLPTRR